MDALTRRGVLAQSAVLAAAALAGGASEAEPAGRPRHLLVIGGHPGDPEAGCGGTIARHVRAGHPATCLYLTRGEAGVRGRAAQEAAEIRSAEAAKACRILGATPVFADQIDGATEVTSARYAAFSKLVAGLSPDVILTQWPVDHHRDHRACALLSFEAWLRLGGKASLYYYEVDLGSDTQCFHPAHYVDVTSTEPLKRDACMAHASQDPAGFYLRDHVPMLRFRGMERGCQFAEAFIHHEQSPPGGLPDGAVS